MKYITIYDEKTKDVLVQIAEDATGKIDGFALEDTRVIVDGVDLFTQQVDEEKYLLDSPTKMALPCSCGACEKDLDIVKTVVLYKNNTDVDVEYKVVCSKCGKESDLAPNENGAVLSWNENMIKGKLQ